MMATMKQIMNGVSPTSCKHYLHVKFGNKAATQIRIHKHVHTHTHTYRERERERERESKPIGLCFDVKKEAMQRVFHQCPNKNANGHH